MTAYYGEKDPFLVQWLRNLVKAELIAPGDVDDRSIKDVAPDDLLGYDQVHFFAGIGGWSFALRMADWFDGQPVWTGSCPCQPFSGVGKRKGFKDVRHLWPEWFRLISICRPSIVFGEQVATAKVWLDQVCSDLETVDYACGTAILPAAGIGTSHRRNRIYFVADANSTRWSNYSRMSATETSKDIRHDVRLVHGEPAEHFRWEAEPDKSWIHDGLQSAGYAVSAFGNSIVPQLAAEFIFAWMECQP